MRRQIPKGTGITKSFGGLKALNGVDFEVREGEMEVGKICEKN